MTGYKSKKAAALDKLNDDDDTQVYKDHGDALTAAYMSGFYDGKKAAEPAQEPVAWMRKMFSPELGEFFDYKDGAFARETDCQGWTPLYTAPPQRTWVGLTNDDWNSTPYDTEFRAGAEWAESKLKEKNNGT